MIWYHTFDFVPVKLESVAPTFFGVEANLLLLLRAEVIALVYFSIFALTRVFSTFAGSPKNFMR
jgi:hypothetical protein